jgi:hypothetical protein
MSEIRVALLIPPFSADSGGEGTRRNADRLKDEKSITELYHPGNSGS